MFRRSSLSQTERTFAREVDKGNGRFGPFGDAAIVSCRGSAEEGNRTLPSLLKMIGKSAA